MRRQPRESYLLNRHFTVVEENNDWLIVDKPAHLLVHPTRPDSPFTLLDGLQELLAYEIAAGGQVSIINRLDRETSGLVLIAKNALSARVLCGWMEARQIHKLYLAIAWGWPDSDNFSVNAPMLRQGLVQSSKIYLRQTVHPDGAVATTDFQVLERLDSPMGRFSLIQASPVTGRTHQIRVHLSHVGLPIVGDKIYGPDENCYLNFIEGGWTEALQEKLLLPRHALHSSSLELPEGGVWKSSLPADLKAFWDRVVHNAYE